MEKQTKTTTATTQTKASKATASKKSKQAKKPAYVDSVQALRNKKPIKIDLPASVEFDSNGGIIAEYVPFSAKFKVNPGRRFPYQLIYLYMNI